MLKPAGSNIERIIRKFVWVFSVFVGIFVTLFFGHYLWESPYFREMHQSIDEDQIVTVVFTQYKGQTFSVEDSAELKDLTRRIRNLKLTSYFKSRQSQCAMTVSLTDGEKIYYYVLFNFKKRIVVFTIQGSPSFSVVGISMGYFEDRNSEFFNWLTQPQRFGSDPVMLRYCSDFSGNEN